MKFSRIYILALAVATAAGCRDAAVETVVPNGGTVVEFSGRSASTRVDVSEQEGSIRLAWSDGDNVGLYGLRNGRPLGGNFSYYAVANGDDPSTCTFRPVSSGNAFRDAAAGDAYYGYYPYSRAAGDDPVHAEVSLPATQYQKTVGDMSHISAYNIMKARPVAVAADGDDVALEFHGIFSIVELRLRLSDGSVLDEVPIKKIALTSASADMAVVHGELDLTAPLGENDLRVVEGGRSVALLFDGLQTLTEEYGSFYFVVAAGAHPSGDITLEVTAVDNSVNTTVLTGVVDFKPNRRYVKSVELAVDDFAAGEPFDAVPSATTIRAGETVNFVFSGSADKIEFFSGEKGHEYRYSVLGRPAAVYMNFFSLYYNGAQRECVKLKYSTDFVLRYADDGTLLSTEDDISNASWTDVTDEFVLPPYITNIDPEANAINNPYDSGTVDVSAWFADDKPVTFAFFYHVDKYDASYIDEKTGKTGNGRTWYQLYTYLAQARFDDGTEPSALVELKATDQSQLEIIHGASYADEPANQHCMKNVSSGGTRIIRMQATFQAKGDRDAYVVTKPVVRPRHVADTGITVKDTADTQPAKYAYLFSEAGTYIVTVKGTVVTLTGSEEVIKEFVITVQE